MSDKNISVRFTLNDKISSGLRKLTSQFDGLKKSTKALTDSTKRTTQETERLIRKAAALRSLKRGYDDAARSAGNLARTLRSIAVRGAAITIAGGAAAGYGVYKAEQAIVGASSTRENLLARLNTSFKGDAGKAQATMADIVKMAKETPFEIDGLTQSFLTLKNFGLDPTTGSMKAAIEQAAALGGSVETLDAITRELGQAWARGKLQGDGIRTLIQNGVPIIEMLAKATGKSADQIDKMSEKGQLNRDVMKKLFAVMASENAGASARAMETYTGQVSMLADAWNEFKVGIGDAGFFTDVKARLKNFVDTFSKFMESTDGKQFAVGISDAFKAINGIAFGPLNTFLDKLKSDPDMLRRFVWGLRVWVGYFQRLAEVYGPKIADFVTTALPRIADSLDVIAGGLALIVGSPFIRFAIDASTAAVALGSAVWAVSKTITAAVASFWASAKALKVVYRVMQSDGIIDGSSGDFGLFSLAALAITFPRLAKLIATAWGALKGFTTLLRARGLIAGIQALAAGIGKLFGGGGGGRGMPMALFLGGIAGKLRLLLGGGLLVAAIAGLGKLREKITGISADRNKLLDGAIDDISEVGGAALMLGPALVNPWVAAGAAIAATSYLLYKHRVEIGKTAKIAAHRWEAMYDSLTASTVRFFRRLNQHWVLIGESLRHGCDLWPIVWDGMLQLLVDKTTAAFARMGEWIGTVAQRAANRWEALFDNLLEPVYRFFNRLNHHWRMIGESFQHGCSRFKEDWAAVGRMLVGRAQWAWYRIKGVMQDNLAEMGTFFVAWGMRLRAGFAEWRSNITTGWDQMRVSTVRFFRRLNQHWVLIGESIRHGCELWPIVWDGMLQLLRDKTVTAFDQIVTGIADATQRAANRWEAWFDNLMEPVYRFFNRLNQHWVLIGESFQHACDLWPIIWDGMLERLLDKTLTVFGKIGDLVKNAWQGAATGGGYDPSGTGSQRGSISGAPPAIGSMIDQYAKAFGVNPKLMKRIAYGESGGNVYAQNRTDSNAKKGTPSGGLFQFIEPTFRRFFDRALKQRPDIFGGLSRNYMDPRSQTALAAWAFRNNLASHWSTWHQLGKPNPVVGPETAGPNFELLSGARNSNCSRVSLTCAYCSFNPLHIVCHLSKPERFLLNQATH